MTETLSGTPAKNFVMISTLPTPCRVKGGARWNRLFFKGLYR